MHPLLARQELGIGQRWEMRHRALDPPRSWSFAFRQMEGTVLLLGGLSSAGLGAAGKIACRRRRLPPAAAAPPPTTADRGLLAVGVCGTRLLASAAQAAGGECARCIAHVAACCTAAAWTRTLCPPNVLAGARLHLLATKLPPRFCLLRPHLPQCLPEEAANDLLRRLLQQRRLGAPQLALFRHCATVVDLSSAAVGAAWLAELGACSALRELRLARCNRLRNAHLQPLAALAPTLQSLDLSGCPGLSSAALAAHLAPLTALRRLDVSGTALASPGLASLAAALTALTSLRADCTAVDDACCQAVGGCLLALRQLGMAGSSVGDAGVQHLEQLQHLTDLDLGRTLVGGCGLRAGP